MYITDIAVHIWYIALWMIETIRNVTYKKRLYARTITFYSESVRSLAVLFRSFLKMWNGIELIAISIAIIVSVLRRSTPSFIQSFAQPLLLLLLQHERNDKARDHTKDTMGYTKSTHALKGIEDRKLDGTGLKIGEDICSLFPTTLVSRAQT